MALALCMLKICYRDQYASSPCIPFDIVSTTLWCSGQWHHCSAVPMLSNVHNLAVIATRHLDIDHPGCYRFRAIYCSRRRAYSSRRRRHARRWSSRHSTQLALTFGMAHGAHSVPHGAHNAQQDSNDVGDESRRHVQTAVKFEAGLRDSAGGQPAIALWGIICETTVYTTSNRCRRARECPAGEFMHARIFRALIQDVEDALERSPDRRRHACDYDAPVYCKIYLFRRPEPPEACAVALRRERLGAALCAASEPPEASVLLPCGECETAIFEDPRIYGCGVQPRPSSTGSVHRTCVTDAPLADRRGNYRRLAYKASGASALLVVGGIMDDSDSSVAAAPSLLVGGHLDPVNEGVADIPLADRRGHYRRFVCKAFFHGGFIYDLYVPPEASRASPPPLVGGHLDPANEGLAGAPVAARRGYFDPVNEGYSYWGMSIRPAFFVGECIYDLPLLSETSRACALLNVGGIIVKELRTSPSPRYTRTKGGGCLAETKQNKNVALFFLHGSRNVIGEGEADGDGDEGEGARYSQERGGGTDEVEQGKELGGGHIRGKGKGVVRQIVCTDILRISLPFVKDECGVRDGEGGRETGTRREREEMEATGESRDASNKISKDNKERGDPIPAEALDVAEKLRLEEELDIAARDAMVANETRTRGVVTAHIAHLIGGGPGNTISECKHASNEVKQVARAERQALKDRKDASKTEATPGANAAATLKRQASKTGGTPDTATKKAKTGQTKLKTYTPAEMPFSPAEAEALRAKALRVTVKLNLPFSIWDDVELLEFIGMLRAQAPAIMPSAKVMSTTMLKNAAEVVDKDMKDKLAEREVGLSTDGWKSRTKAALSAVCLNVHTLKLIDTTSMNKDGPAQCKQFEDMIDDAEEVYKCQVLYFVTDGDGGSSKGRKLLVKNRPYMLAPTCWGHQGQLMLGDYFRVNDYAAEISETATGLIGWINNHGKVRMLFNKAQAECARHDATQKTPVLAFLVANITRWTTHVVAFMRLLDLKKALQVAVMLSRAAIIEAQVGAAKYAEKDRLELEANEWCNTIADPGYWNGLEDVLGDLEAICYGININQQDSVSANKVLLMIAGIYLQFEAHPERAVSFRMTERLEKRWADCDQPLFLLALILDPFDGLTRFGDNAGLDHLTINAMATQLWRRMRDRPDNADSAETRLSKETELSAALLRYLAGTGSFASWETNREVFEQTHGRDPLMAWTAFTRRDTQELARFAKTIYSVVVNTAGCERTFSRLKIIQSPHRSRIGTEKMEQMMKVSSQITAENVARGVVKARTKRKNHKGTQALLEVPRYRDVLEDQNDEEESERGRLLVNTRAGWRTEMAKWVAAARAAEEDEFAASLEDSVDEMPTQPIEVPARLVAQQPAARRIAPFPKKTLKELFSGLPPVRTVRLIVRGDTREQELMHALAVSQRASDGGDGDVGDSEECAAVENGTGDSL
ncbi:ribonuclease H-like domain-containing protein [Schizophyllum amplum]|uniref:Ribonuclease H-like domain-containing protein n=1 Tax=Schizophyllum amplum TaxID=97359 RepID=A0A550CE49_9AGAR|nr:ribonuclease H-like domain-containing protein [Auriculariopsis ampla]